MLARCIALDYQPITAFTLNSPFGIELLQGSSDLAPGAIQLSTPAAIVMMHGASDVEARPGRISLDPFTIRMGWGEITVGGDVLTWFDDQTGWQDQDGSVWAWQEGGANEPPPP